MYDLSDLSQAIRSPRSIPREMNRLVHTRGRRLPHNPSGMSVFDADWDNLVVLDACRYDAFAARADLPGRTEARTSKGGVTWEWVKANFAGRTRHDTVYVTANSWYQKLREDIDAEIHRLVDLHMGDETGIYHSDRFDIVLPETMTERAIEIADEHPNKRLVVHYIQPHHPFVGERGATRFDNFDTSLYDMMAESDVTAEQVREAYAENLDVVLESVADLLDHLRGKTVVTADHGEMLGDRHDYVPVRDYGHHEGVYNDALTKVPWHVHSDGERKDVVAEAPVESDSEADDEALESRLADLGYRM